MYSPRSYGIVAVTAALICAAPVWAQTTSFSGTYTGKSDDSTFTLKLEQSSDGTVTGSLTEEGNVTQLKGMVSEDKKRVTGKVLLNGQELPIEFEVRREGERFRFAMKAAGEEEVTYFTRNGKAVEVKAEPVKPAPAKPAPARTAKKSASTPAAPAALATGNAYKHPSGIRMNLPAGWKIVQPGTSPVLLPPGATKPDGDELYLLLMGDASGIESKDDPRLTQFIEEMLNGKGGLFSSNMSFEKAESSSGLAYTGTTAQGQAVYARCFFSQPKGVVAAVLAVGLKSRIQPREKAMQSAAASVTVGAMENDARLVGNWSGKVIPGGIDARDAAGRLQASSTTDSSTTYRVGADGTFMQEKHSRTIAIGQGVSLDSGDQVERVQGRWFAGNGVIAIVGENGLFNTGTYRFEGGQLILRIGGQAYALSQ